MTPRLFPATAGSEDASPDGAGFDFDAQLDNDTWLTPRWILEQLGEFDLDPCAAQCYPEWTGASHVLTPNHNNGRGGLSHAWEGRVFLNPPFSDIAPWVEKMAAHGDGIALLPAGHETEAWARFVWGKASAILLLRGRVRFTGPDGATTRGRPRCPVALVSYDPQKSTTARGVWVNYCALEDFKAHGVFLPAEGWRIRP